MPREFDPKSEKHFPLLIIKAVEPGCTTELQIEICSTGQVERLTTADDAETDDKLFDEAVLRAFRAAWKVYQYQHSTLRECPACRSHMIPSEIACLHCGAVSD